MRQKLWYCQATDTIRTAENMLLLFRNESIWSNVWLLTFDHAVDDTLVHLAYKYLQQATGFTSDGQVMVDGLNKFISENTYSEKIFSVAGRRSGIITRIIDSIIQKLFKLRWIPIDEKEVDCTIEDEGIYYSKYLEIKVKGYEHPFIGYYVKANDDEFFDFIHKTVMDDIKQEDITHYRFIP